MQRLQITVLVNNTVRQKQLIAEHGLALWIEADTQSYLFDFGQHLALAHNAAELGIPLANANALILSHGHYDHANGLAHVIDQLPAQCPFYAHPDAIQPKYVIDPNGKSRPAGIDHRLIETINQRFDFRPVSQPTKVGRHLNLTGPIPRLQPFEDTGGRFFLDTQANQPDPLTDDQAAWIDTPHGLVVILGCAHAGIINTLEYISQLTHHRPIHTIIGGMHLVNADDDRINATIAAIRQINPQLLAAMHCTGFLPTCRLQQMINSKVTEGPVAWRWQGEPA